MPGFHFYTREQETVEPPNVPRSAYFFAGAGVVHLSLVEYVVLRMTGSMPRPRHVLSYKQAMRPEWKQAEFTVRAVSTKDEPAPAPKPERKMPHHQQNASPKTKPQSTYGTRFGGLGGMFQSPFGNNHEDT